jgi:hypothetical protein
MDNATIHCGDEIGEFPLSTIVAKQHPKCLAQRISERTPEHAPECRSKCISLVALSNSLSLFSCIWRDR